MMFMGVIWAVVVSVLCLNLGNSELMSGDKDFLVMIYMYCMSFCQEQASLSLKLNLDQ